MPTYRVRLEAPDDEHARIEQVLADHPNGVPGRVDRHFRESDIAAPTPEDAQRALERRELKRVLFELPDDEVATADLNQALAHYQELPYSVVSVEEL